MIEIGDMVYYRGEKWTVGLTGRKQGKQVGIHRYGKRSWLVPIEEVKPIYRNGVKVTA